MATNPNRTEGRTLAGPLVLAFLMVVTALAGILPHPAAADLSTRPTGTVMVTAEPDFELPDYNPMGPSGSIWYPWHGDAPGPSALSPQVTTNPIPNYPTHPVVVYAKPRGGDADGACPNCFQRTVRLAFGNAAQATGPNRIDFVFYVRDLLSNPPCNDAATGWSEAMDPCKDKGILWRPDYSYATRPGWKVYDNRENQIALSSGGRGWSKSILGSDEPPALVLTFERADGSAQDAPSSLTGADGHSCNSAPLSCSLDVVIAFQVMGSPNGDQGMDNFPQAPPDEFHIQINRYPSGDGASFESTCHAYKNPQNTVNAGAQSPQSPFTCVYTGPPFSCYVPSPPPPGSDDYFTSATCPAAQTAAPPQFQEDPPLGVCSNGGEPYCGTPSLVIRMDDTQPTVLETLNGDARFGPDGPPPEGGKLAGPTPCVCSFVAYDTDHNGHLDRFTVSFTEPIDPQSFDYHQFTIQTKGRDRPYTITNSFFEPWDPSVTGEERGQCITATRAATETDRMKVFTMPGSTCRAVFQVAEMPFYDTGDTPNLVYPCTTCNGIGTVADRAGNLLRRISGSTLVAIDRAPPILVSAYALDPAHTNGHREAGSYLHIFFSENVMGSGSAFTATGFEAGAVLVSDLCYQDGIKFDGSRWTDNKNVIGAPGNQPMTGCFAMNAPYDTAAAVCQPVVGGTGPCRYFEAIYHAPQQPGSFIGTVGGGWRMVAATQPDPDDTANRLDFGADDVHPFYGDMIGVQHVGVGLSRNCAPGNVLREQGPDFGDPDTTKWYPCDSNVRDLHDNGAWYPQSGFVPTAAFPHPPALAHVSFPLLESVTVDTSNPDCPAAVPGLGYGPEDPKDLGACHYWMKLKFNGPVRGPADPSGCDTNKGTAKSPKPFYACNVDIKTAAGTGQGPQGFLGPAPPGTTSTTGQAPYYLVADSDTAILEMDHAARPVDVSLNPSQVKVQCNTIYATPGFAPDLSTDIVPADYGKKSLWYADQSVGMIPCDDPDQYYGPDQDADPDNGGVLKKNDADIVDVTPPRIIAASTVDADSNGYLDGVRLTFSEPVDDATFCGGGSSVLTAPTYCPDVQDGQGFVSFSRWASSGRSRITAAMDIYEEECKAGKRGPLESDPLYAFRWDSGLLSNDNTGVIQHVVVTKVDDAYVTRVQDCEEFFRNRWTGLRWPTDELLHMTTPSPQLFKDLASRPFHDNSDLVCTAPTSSCYLRESPNSLPSECQFDSRAFGLANLGYQNFLAVHPPPVSGCSTKAKSVDSVRITDGAPPVLMRAQTYDTPIVDFNGVTRTKNTEKYLNLYGDGTLDGYRLTFSEAVNDGSFNRADWHVEGYHTDKVTPCGSTTAVDYASHNVTKDTWLVTNAPMRTYDTTLNSATDVDKDIISQSANDNMFILLYTPAKDLVVRPDGCPELHMAHDTDAKPDLTGSGTGGHLHLTDLKGNAMLDFDTFAVQEEDDAGPQVWRIEGFSGTDQIKMYFSEPVDDGAHGGLVRDDFQYFDKNVKDVAGLSSTKPVDNQAGDRDATLFLGGTLSASDQSNDKIAVRFCRVYETAPSVDAGSRKCVPNFIHPLLQQNDTTAPGPITDFHVVQSLAKANSLTASWTAPGDDDLVGGPVSGYFCIASPDPLPAVLTGNETNVNGAQPKYDPPLGSLAEPGRTQTVTMAGLDSEKTYYMGCAAQDELGNEGAFSNTDSGKTTRDTTPPTGTIVISSDHTEGVADKRRAILFTWTDIGNTDPESTVVYHYKLDDCTNGRPNSQPNYIVLATDGSTTDTKAPQQTAQCDGDLYFHVAGFSAGGSTPTAHFHVVIGLPPLNAADIEKANDLIDLKAFRQEDTFNGELVELNNVTWTLPADTTPPGLRDITGVEIWRNDRGVFTKVTTITGTYDTLKTGYYKDVSAGANADSKYRVDMVFSQPPKVQSDPVKGYTALEDQTPTPVPPWIFVLAGITLALILSGLVIFFILRRRQKEEGLGGVAYSWESANPELVGIDEATGLPVHEVRCPSCNNPFQAVGALPLPVTCPTCGTTGMLD